MQVYLSAIDKVAETWALVKAIDNYEIVVGRILFNEIFRIAPQALGLYSFGDRYQVSNGEGAPDEMFEDHAFQLHAKSVVLTLESAVLMMVKDDVSKLGDTLVTLGARHVSYGVHPAHYSIVETALLRTLAGALQERWTPEIRKSWAAVFKLVSRCMQAGAGSQLEVMKIKRRQRVQQESAVLRLRVIGHSEGTSRLARSRRSSSTRNEKTKTDSKTCNNSRRPFPLGDTGPPKMPIRKMESCLFENDLEPLLSDSTLKKLDEEDDSTISTMCLDDDEVRTIPSLAV